MDAYISGVSTITRWMSDEDQFIPSIIYLLLSNLYDVFDIRLRANRKCNTLPTLFDNFLKRISEAFVVKESADMSEEAKTVLLDSILSVQDLKDVADLIIFVKKYLLALMWKGWSVVGACETGEIDTGSTVAHIVVSNVAAAVLISGFAASLIIKYSFG